MAKNDKIIIDSIIDERLWKTPWADRGSIFEQFSYEQLLKNYDLTDDELQDGNVDWRNDWWIDGFFMFINGHYLADLEDFTFPKSGISIEIYIITCKHQDSFIQAPLDNIVASISELFDFSLENEELKLEYSKKLLIKRARLIHAYKKCSLGLEKFRIWYYYISRWDSSGIWESIISRSEQIKKITDEFFENCNSEFRFYWSSEIIELYRKRPKFTLELPFSNYLSSGQTYILLVNLYDYYLFLSNDWNLSRHLFDSNVRDFMWLNRVNEDIRNTLLNPNSTDFWWLNNWVTILSTGASIVWSSINIENIQIVNWLQTSESIFRYFSGWGKDERGRSVLVKVIVSTNPVDRDSIIRATNNQTVVELSALHATDKIQRDIEDALKLNDYYYERRTNYYKNQWIPVEKIVTPLYIASWYLSLVLKSPSKWTSLKSKFMRKEESYWLIFSEEMDLKVWGIIAYILKNTDIFLEKKRLWFNKSKENFLKRYRHYLSFLTLSIFLKRFNFTALDLINIDLRLLTEECFDEAWNYLITKNESGTYWIGPSLFDKICIKIAEDYKISDYTIIEKKSKETWRLKENQRRSTREITPDFLDAVDKALPQQPWKPWIHFEIAKKLWCSKTDLREAIAILIKLWRRLQQIDWVLYDNSGVIVGYDEERVSIII